MIATTLLLAAQALTFSADRIAADNTTKAMTATGHVVAVDKPYSLHGEWMKREVDGTMTFGGPCFATTCSNEVGHTHWNVSGEIEYKEDDHVILKNACLRFYEIPVFWLPYMYYSLSHNSGFSWMPGYTGRWGAYLLTKTSYNILGNRAAGDNAWWLDGATRFDLRYRQGVGFGEDLKWNLGEFGRGDFYAYYAWDRDIDDYSGDRLSDYTSKHHSYNWESPVNHDRYAFSLRHNLNLTERDRIRVQGSYYSDSSFRHDFQRKSLFNWKSQWLGYDNSGIFWEHLENTFAIGAEVSGRLNKFYAMTGRLPEIYLDINPQPVFGLPVNYESENRIGYLTRDPAEYGTGDPNNPFAFRPGRWAEYEAFRFDTYHRLTAPFRTFDDVVSVVPRVAYHGTYWSKTGKDNLNGWGKSESAGDCLRSILEGGVTFAGRGTAWVDDKWRHMIEPYFDVLAQKAWFSGGDRPYVFDNIDASVMWEDQFAGRARNLPYTYYGVTPGVRNAWDKLNDRGDLRTVVDLDVYAAFQFESTSFISHNEAHKLSEVGRPNYGKNGCFVMPGARVRWMPVNDISLMANAEYDSDHNRIASADAGLKHKVANNFSYDITYSLRDYRCWDFSSSPYDPKQMTDDLFNYAKFHYVQIGFEHQPLDWFAWGPYLRWDIRENELDGVGSWFDFLTDCLGFRFIVEYDNSYTRLDGYEHGDDWSVGFYIYLRALGSGASNIFSTN